MTHTTLERLPPPYVVAVSGFAQLTDDEKELAAVVIAKLEQLQPANLNRGLSSGARLRRWTGNAAPHHSRYVAEFAVPVASPRGPNSGVSASRCD